MRIAAMVAGKFSMDPIIVLKSDRFEWAVRLAAYRYYTAKEEEAAKRQRAASETARGRKY